MCYITYSGILEGSLLFLLSGFLPHPGKYASSASVQDEGVLSDKQSQHTKCRHVKRIASTFNLENRQYIAVHRTPVLLIYTKH